MERNSKKPYKLVSSLFMTLDPVHIGTGGYRLGGVDMTIVREPGTDLPKIPGTSLTGMARSYAALRYGKPDAAGQHKNLKQEDKQRCPIIYTFGTATDKGGGQAGTVSIGDARLLFFPVSSVNGPVWVTTTEQLCDAWGEGSYQLPKPGEKEVEPDDTGVVITSLRQKEQQAKQQLNLGWLLLEAVNGLEVTPPSGISSLPEWEAVQNRLVLVTPKFFSAVVNSNLEVRTSVSIDPETGAAEEGALFTYEAIPRATWLWSDIIEDDYRRDNFPETNRKCKVKADSSKNNIASDSDQDKREKSYQENAGELLGENWGRPLDVVKSGLKLAEYLGVGGMNTRGFGRLRCLVFHGVD